MWITTSVTTCWDARSLDPFVRSEREHTRTHDRQDPPRAVDERSIMVAVNGGPSGWPALDWAAAEASAHHSDLRIMHAISWPRWGFDPLGELALDWCNTNAPEQGTRSSKRLPNAPGARLQPRGSRRISRPARPPTARFSKRAATTR